MLIGDSAGGVNVPKIKGIHQAIRSGMLAAENLAEVGSPDGFDARWRASPGGRLAENTWIIMPSTSRKAPFTALPPRATSDGSAISGHDPSRSSKCSRDR